MQEFYQQNTTGAIAPVSIDRSRKLAWWDVQRTVQNQVYGASADPTQSHWLQSLHLQNTYNLLFGRIVDSVAYMNCYKVQPENGLTSIWCTALTATALQPIGAKQLGQLPVGCGVLFAKHQSDYYGLIIGVIPDIQTSSDTAMADFISQAARCGLLVDKAHSSPLDLIKSSLLNDWSAGRPLDSLAIGEHGQITETGLLQFIDSFMTSNRVDEECGIWHFFHDQLTRLTGHNLQVWSAGSEREDLDDEGEVTSIQGYTPYYWEALGAFDFETNICRDYSAECYQKDTSMQMYAASEPCNDEQVAFYRLRDFYGYLGQAHKRTLCLPPVKCEELVSSDIEDILLGDGTSSIVCGECIEDSENLNLLTTEYIYPGVFEENLALTGRYSIRTAHEFIISKQINIPSPKLIKRPEDPTGDNSNDYKAAGQLGAGTDHLVTGEIENGSVQETALIQAAGFLDVHAFAFNWIGNHPFHYHEKDWYLPEETELAYISESCNSGPNIVPPAFEELACYQYLQTPTAIPLRVDHRYENVNYYPNHSYFGLLAAGGVVIGDGFGSEIRMSNGSIWITCPGDMFIQSGRNIVSLAGYDHIIRAKNSWDISATEHDGRLVAKRNLWMAATGEYGGILIQSKATKPVIPDNDTIGQDAVLGGIVIKAENSLLSLYSQDMSFKLSDTEDDKVHSLIFDVGWSGKIRFKAKYFERFLSVDGGAYDFWTEPLNDSGIITDTTIYQNDLTLFCMPVLVDNKLMVSGCSIFGENLFVVDGHVATTKAEEVGGKVGFFNDQEAIVQFEDIFDKMLENCIGDIPEAGDRELDTLVDRQNNYTLNDAEFSFRTPTQYRTNDFILYESRWQQIARINGTTTATWKELEIQHTSPYPGKEILDGDSYLTLDTFLFDIPTQLANIRGSIYETPAFEPIQLQSLNSAYSVII